MKNALISPNEPRETGYRVAQVEDNTFDVAKPLFWVECEDYIVADEYWYNPDDGTINLITLPIILDENV